MEDSPSLLFKDNLKEVYQLMAMHAKFAGKGVGRKYHVDVLNKSAILFACASFEAFIEDLATRSFDHLILKSRNHTALPKAMLKSIAEVLRNDKNEIKIWDLAGDGWRTVAEHYKENVIQKYIVPFHAPKPDNIEALLRRLIGFPESYPVWRWRGMSEAASKKKLTTFVELRGALAHGSKPSPRVLKKDVFGYGRFLAALSVRLSNDVLRYCQQVTGEKPWQSVRYGAIR